jgi:hypothetical protein
MKICDESVIAPARRTTLLASGFRDRLARWLCNLILRTIATPWYRDRIDSAIRYGLASAARDKAEKPTSTAGR